MKLQIPFSEISEIAMKKVHKDVTLECVNENTVNAKVKIGFLSPSKKVTVVGVRGNDIYLKMGELFSLVSGWLGDIQNYFSTTDDGLIVVHLAKIEKLREPLEKIAIDTISFDGNGVSVSFHLNESAL